MDESRSTSLESSLPLYCKRKHPPNRGAILIFKSKSPVPFIVITIIVIIIGIIMLATGNTEFSAHWEF